jgi:hypothetical protein
VAYHHSVRNSGCAPVSCGKSIARPGTTGANSVGLAGTVSAPVALDGLDGPVAPGALCKPGAALAGLLTLKPAAKPINTAQPIRSRANPGIGLARMSPTLRSTNKRRCHELRFDLTNPPALPLPHRSKLLLARPPPRSGKPLSATPRPRSPTVTREYAMPWSSGTTADSPRIPGSD